MANNYMPITLSVNDRSCLVVGGGAVALRKVETLLDYETSITVISPEVDPKLESYLRRGKIRLEQRQYRSPEAASYGLVISASDEVEVNQTVCEDCRTAGVLVNVVDDPSRCDFIFPAVIRRDCLTAAVATDGKAPYVSAHLRVILGSIFPEHWNKLMRHATTFRKNVQKRWEADTVKKNDCYARFLDADWKTMLKQMSPEEIQEELNRMLGE